MMEPLKGDRKGQHSVRVNDRLASASSGRRAMRFRSKSWTTI